MRLERIEAVRRENHYPASGTSDSVRLLGGLAIVRNMFEYLVKEHDVKKVRRKWKALGRGLVDMREFLARSSYLVRVNVHSENLITERGHPSNIRTEAASYVQDSFAFKGSVATDEVEPTVLAKAPHVAWVPQVDGLCLSSAGFHWLLG